MAPKSVDVSGINKLIAGLNRQHSDYEHAKMIACNGDFKPGEMSNRQQNEKRGTSAIAQSSNTGDQANKPILKRADKRSDSLKNKDTEQDLAGIGGWAK